MRITKNQLNNVFYFKAIMIIDNKVINTSPDYLIEKSMTFFGRVGKNEFVSNIENMPYTQKNDNFWNEYCKRWRIKNDDYEILNIINFLFYSNFYEYGKVLNGFKKYIGDFSIINDIELGFKVHPNLKNAIDIVIEKSLNDRYVKLLFLP